MMNKKVLIPTDFSSTALNALRYVLELYKDVPCTFFLLHAFQVSGYSIDSPWQPEAGDVALVAAKEEAENGLSDLLEKIGFHPANPMHRFETIATYNSLLHAVRSAIDTNDIDLVVMGTKGITGAESLIFGTNAINIMEGITSCPVLAIPEAYGFEPPHEIVFPTDFKADFAKEKLHCLEDIAILHGASINVLHIQKSKKLSDLQKNNKQLLTALLERTDYSFHLVDDNKVHRGIGNFVQIKESNMIAFINRKHSVLDRLLSRPLVKEMGYHYKIPILALTN